MDTKNVVTAWKERVTIPTYQTGEPEKNPIFLENRVYQGSSGVVYPHPVVEKISDHKTPREYQAVFLENRYLRIMILPELGGRIQMAYDKIRERHFIYYNQVIKPALVGLTGPWISGGIEFNWPQHHRPSTFEPVDYSIEAHDDGSKTVWVSEVERMFRTKGMAGFRLYPDHAYLEINARLFNRTPFPQTFLWWANPAVKVNDHYQSVFPPDVHAVFDHGKRDVSEFPIAKGKYYKVDYAPGTDISRYKNIPVPTSYMAVKSKYDFMGGYEHDTQAGVLHVANHHISPGKKQWTWGNGEFGYAWDRNLTDEDGPYIELMTGVFTDNQPDFSWIQPYEERTFTQYFMPYSQVGVVKNATRDAMVNLEVTAGKAIIRFYTTSVFYNASATLRSGGGALLFERVITISPEAPCEYVIEHRDITGEAGLHVSLTAVDGKLLVDYTPESSTSKPVPDAAVPAKDPGAISSNEQLFLTGQHIEQYRHATYKATDYYEEALRRDPSDVRSNHAMGLYSMRRARFDKAEGYFRTAIASLTQRNPNPYECEPYVNLGITLVYQDRAGEAVEYFYKAVWNGVTQEQAYLWLARLACAKSDFREGLELIEKCLIRNSHNHTARHLKAICLRKLGKKNPHTWISSSLDIDAFSFGTRYELFLTDRHAEVLNELRDMMRGNLHTYLEYAFDYALAGQYQEAIDLLQIYLGQGGTYPIAYYAMGYFLQRLGDGSSAEWFFKGRNAPSDYCFPNRIDETLILHAAIASDPNDSKALYYLGNFWYANGQYDYAIACWEKSHGLEPTFPTPCRNLALAYHNKRHDEQAALAMLEKSFRLNPHDPRVLMELDQLHKKLNKDHSERLAMLDQYDSLTKERDDLYLEMVTLYNHLGEHARAIELLADRKFHPWEGGEGKVVGQYLLAHTELAKQALEDDRFDDALQHLMAAKYYPDNFGEGKLYGVQENDTDYLMGCAYEGLENQSMAQASFIQATKGLSEPALAVYYNDQQPDKIFYQGLAWKKLGDKKRSDEIFSGLISFGRQHLNDEVKIDYFAVSLPDLLVFDQNLDMRNRVHCHYLIGLGNLGMGVGHLSDAEDNFDQVLRLDINHAGARFHRKMISHPVVQD